jgi:heat shock protein 5
VNDENQLGGKLSEEDKKSILDALKAKSAWLDTQGSSASKEDIEEQKAELESIVNPITSKLYDGGAGSSGESGEPQDHDEL